MEFLGPFTKEELINDNSITTILNYNTIESNQFLVKGNFIANKTGLYRFIFNNKASWINEKLLRYRIFVLEQNNIPNIYTFPLFSKVSTQENTEQYVSENNI